VTDVSAGGESRVVVSAAPDWVRLSFLSSHTQVDVSLPLDVPIASLAPELVRLVRSREATQSGTPGHPFTTPPKHNLSVLSRFDGKTPLSQSITLREAGVADGELLRLTARDALSPPTLYDDVVDAAARLNKVRYAGWDSTTARWMAFVGVHLASVAWVYFLVADALAPHRGALVGLSVIVASALVGVAALARRSYGQDDAAAALGWAALPIAAAIVWIILPGWRGYGAVAGSATMVIVCVVVFRAVGTGHWGYLAAGVFFCLSGVALVIHAAGVSAVVVGAGLAVTATLGCRAVPLLTVRSAHPAKPRDRQRGDEGSANPQASSQETKPEEVDAATPLTAEDVWARVRSATLTRSGVYAGLAINAGVGASAVLLSSHPARWSDLAFTAVCAAMLGFCTQRPDTAEERAALGIPAVALAVFTCVRAQDGSPPMPLAAFSALVTAIVVFAVVGTRARTGRPSDPMRTVLAYSNYLAAAALIPLALWVADAYQRLGIT
jgi:type VII secretion integral membrane protein EccD